MKRRHDKPTKQEFKTFWSVFEAQQQRRAQQESENTSDDPINKQKNDQKT